MKKIIILTLLLLAATSFANTKDIINIDFNNAPLPEVLNYLAKFSKKNVVIDQTIQGDLSIHLQQVSWTKALDVILRSHNLSQRIDDNIIYIAPTDEIAKQEKMEETSVDDSPLTIKLFQLNYAKASDIANLLMSKEQSLLSPRGHVSTDNRTNAVLVRDNVKQIDEISQFIKQLDIPVKQVLIEARIVTLDQNHERDLGIRWNINPPPKNNPSSENLSRQLNVDLPTLDANSTGLGVALTKINTDIAIDLELAALESEGSAEIISNPKLMTSNQQTAKIEAGEEIPYQEKAGERTTSIAFKKAVLSLEVTPQITPNKKIILHLDVAQDKPSSTEVLGVPTISTRHIQTQVLVDNEQTIVLGGIYEKSTTHSIDRVPFLSNIPLIGELFKQNHDTTNRRELLIFVTPKIV
jgi:type IV pilus assembly protein PilQ